MKGGGGGSASAGKLRHLLESDQTESYQNRHQGDTLSEELERVIFASKLAKQDSFTQAVSFSDVMEYILMSYFCVSIQ